MLHRLKGEPLRRGDRVKHFTFSESDVLPVTEERLRVDEPPKALLYYAAAEPPRPVRAREEPTSTTTHPTTTHPTTTQPTTQPKDYVIKIFGERKYYDRETAVLRDVALRCGRLTMRTYVNDERLAIVLPRMDMDLIDWYDQYLARSPNPCLYLRDVRDMFRHLLRTLACLHRHGIFYLDMKLDNVLVDVGPDGHIRKAIMIDFDGSVAAGKDRPRGEREGLSTYPYPAAYDASLRAIDLWNVGYMFLLFWIRDDAALKEYLSSSTGPEDLRARVTHLARVVVDTLKGCAQTPEDVALIDTIVPFLDEAFSCSATECGPHARSGPVRGRERTFKTSTAKSLLKTEFMTHT